MQNMKNKYFINLLDMYVTYRALIEGIINCTDILITYYKGVLKIQTVRT